MTRMTRILAEKNGFFIFGKQFNPFNLWLKIKLFPTHLQLHHIFFAVVHQ
jgi:hypothetical protein